MLSITFSTNRFVHVASVRRVRVHPDRLDALDKQPPRVALFFFKSRAARRDRRERPRLARLTVRCRHFCFNDSLETTLKLINPHTDAFGASQPCRRRPPRRRTTRRARTNSNRDDPVVENAPRGPSIANNTPRERWRLRSKRRENARKRRR